MSTLEAFRTLSELESIIPALESSHAVALAKEIAADVDEDDVRLVNLSGRGDEDVEQAAEMFDMGNPVVSEKLLTRGRLNDAASSTGARSRSRSTRGS